MNPKNLTFFSYEAHSSFIVLFSPLTKHNLLLSIFLENERSFTFLLFCWMIKILLLLWCVSEAAVQYHRHVYSIRNCLFVCFSVTLVKPEKPLKVPEVENFYESIRCSATIFSIWNDTTAWMSYRANRLWKHIHKYWYILE